MSTSKSTKGCYERCIKEEPLRASLDSVIVALMVLRAGNAYDDEFGRGMGAPSECWTDIINPGRIGQEEKKLNEFGWNVTGFNRAVNERFSDWFIHITSMHVETFDEERQAVIESRMP